MTRLIDADELKLSFCRECTLYPDKCLEETGYGCDWHAIWHIQMMQTIDAVPVVRCKDCKHWQKVPWAKEKRCIVPRWGTARPTEGTDFCSDGERVKE